MQIAEFGHNRLKSFNLETKLYEEQVSWQMKVGEKQ
jgi:hypothetical protein